MQLSVRIFIRIQLKIMKEKTKFNWTAWRNRNVWLKGKKIKLRHYVSINANIMKQLNKPGWQGVDHYLNYKIALSRYGLKGLKYYENRFYHSIPMPYKQTWLDRFKIWVLIKLEKIKKYLKRNS